MDLPKVRPQSDYLYERRGPWPQPQPAHPFGFAPGVTHVPPDELRKWNRTTGLRYMWTILTYWPKAFIYAWKNPTLEPLSDDVFEKYLTHSSLSKFISNELNERSEFPNNAKLTIFKEFLDAEPNQTFWVSDFSLMSDMDTLPGIFAAPTMALFKGSLVGGQRKVVAIYFPANKYRDEGIQKVSEPIILTPQDGNAWELAKYFVMQGASHRISLSAHANLHFPYDSINAISKSCLPKDSLLLRLLLPHFELTLELNYSVLNSKTSPLQNPSHMPYAALAGGPDALGALFLWGYVGVEGNPSYIPYKFQMAPKQFHSDYGTFLMDYFDVVEKFVVAVIEEIPKDEYEEIEIWANYVNSFVPEFPKGDEIFIKVNGAFEFAKDEEKTVLANAIANIIWDLSVGHAVDHYDYSSININHMPFRLRVPPPQSKDIPPIDFKKIITWQDIFKHKYERQMFFIPRNWKLLKDTEYNFYKPHEEKLRILNREFLASLHTAEKELKVHNYIPLDNISSSIQY